MLKTHKTISSFIFILFFVSFSNFAQKDGGDKPWVVGSDCQGASIKAFLDYVFVVASTNSSKIKLVVYNGNAKNKGKKFLKKFRGYYSIKGIETITIFKNTDEKKINKVPDKIEFFVSDKLQGTFTIRNGKKDVISKDCPAEIYSGFENDELP